MCGLTLKVGNTRTYTIHTIVFYVYESSNYSKIKA